MPVFRMVPSSSRNKIDKFPSSDYIMKNGLLIGCHQGLSHKDILYIHSVVSNFKKLKKNI